MVDFDSIDDDSQSELGSEVENLPTKPVSSGYDDIIRTEPFHVYINKDTFGIKSGLVAVRVIIESAVAPSYKFHLDSGIYGVGVGYYSKTAVLCGSTKLDYTKKYGRSVATFYIDLDKFYASVATANGAAFNIIIQPSNSSETPIYIDPKVHNDG